MADTISGAVRLPGMDTLVAWPPRKAGLVRVLMFLKLRERVDPRPLELSLFSEPDRPRLVPSCLRGDHRELVALELAFRREALRETLEQASHVTLGQHMVWWVVSIWEELLRNVPVRDYWTGDMEFVPEVRRHASTVTMAGCYHVDLDSGMPELPYRLYVRQEALETIRRSLGENLRIELQLALPQVMAEWALHRRPRGKQARAPFLMPVLRTALFVTNEVVCSDDRRIRARLFEILQEDPEGMKLLALAERAREGQLLREARVVLVDRTLRPAFKPYGVRPLCERSRSADQIYAEFLGKQERQTRTDLAGAGPPTLARWIDRILGPEGQTARDFDLL